MGSLHTHMGGSLLPARNTLGKEAGNPSVMTLFLHLFNSYVRVPGGEGQTGSGERVRRCRRGKEVEED